MSNFIEQTIDTITNINNNMTKLQNTDHSGNTITYEFNTNKRNYVAGSPDNNQCRCPFKALSDYTGFYCTNCTMDDSSQDDDQSKDLNKDGIYCGTCGVDFDTLEQYGAHNPYKCLVDNNGMDCLSCGMHFDSYDEYENDHNPDICRLRKTMYECNGCGTEFKTYEEFDNHNPDICWTNNHPILDCSSCGAHFETEVELTEHCPDNCWYNNVDFDCTCCGVHFDTQAELLEHDENQCWNTYEQQNPDKCWTPDDTKFDCTCCKMHFETYDELHEHDERICWTDFTNKYLARLSEEDCYMYRGSGNLEEDLEKEYEEKMAQLDQKHAELEKEELYRIELE